MKNTSAVVISVALLAAGLGIGFVAGCLSQATNVDRARQEAEASKLEVWGHAVKQLESARDSLIWVARHPDSVSSIEREFEYYIETTQQLADGRRKW